MNKIVISCGLFCIHVSSALFDGPLNGWHDNRRWRLASGQKESLPSSRSCAIGDMFSWRDLNRKPSMFRDPTCLFCMSLLTQGEVSPATARGQPGCSELEPSRNMPGDSKNKATAALVRSRYIAMFPLRSITHGSSISLQAATAVLGPGIG